MVNGPAHSKKVRKSNGATPVSGGKNKRTRHRAVQEMKKYQRSEKLIMQRQPLRQMVKKIMADIAMRRNEETPRIQDLALTALQADCESFIVNTIREATDLAVGIQKRKTIKPSDIEHVVKISKDPCMRIQIWNSNQKLMAETAKKLSIKLAQGKSPSSSVLKEKAKGKGNGNGKGKGSGKPKSNSQYRKTLEKINKSLETTTQTPQEYLSNPNTVAV